MDSKTGICTVNAVRVQGVTGFLDSAGDGEAGVTDRGVGE